MSDGQHLGMLKAWWSAVAALEVLLAIIVFAVPDVRTWLEDHSWPGAWILVAILLPIALGSSGTAYARGKSLRAVDRVDVEQFEVFRARLPENRGAIDFLELFDGKRWKDSQVSPLEDTAREWEQWEFKNKKAQRAFASFRRAQSAFTGWSTEHGHFDVSTNGAGWYTSDYDPSSKASRDVRAQGLKLAHQLREAIIEFHRVGRREQLRSA